MDFADIQPTFKKQEDMVEYRENPSHRNNIRIEGIAEDENATWLNTENNERKEKQDKLHLEFEHEIEGAQRVGPKTRSAGASNIADSARNNPRIIVCRLRDWKQKERVLCAALEEPNKRVCLSMKILQQ